MPTISEPKTPHYQETGQFISAEYFPNSRFKQLCKDNHTMTVYYKWLYPQMVAARLTPSNTTCSLETLDCHPCDRN